MKPVSEWPINSSSIVGLIKHAITGKSRAVKVLRDSVWARFYDVCDAVEDNDTIRQMTVDYFKAKKISKGRLTKLRKFLREQAWVGSDSDIENLSEQITIILSEDTNFLPKSLEWLTKIVGAFVDAFIQMYDYTPDDSVVSGGVAVKTRRPWSPNEDAESWEEDQETSDQGKKHVHIIRNLCSHVDSYTRYLDARANRIPSVNENQAEIYSGELANERWKFFRQVVLSLKKIRLNAKAMAFIEDTHYDTANDIQDTIKAVDAYSILFDDHKGKVKDTKKAE